MVKKIILAGLMFSAGSVFGGQYVECSFLETDQTIRTRLSDHDAEKVYDTLSAAFEAEERRSTPSAGGYSAPERRCGFGTKWRCP